MRAAAAPEPQVVTFQDGITPFWRKLPAFFAYPLHASPLVCIGTLAVLSIVTAFVGGLFRGLLAYLFLRYAFSVMEQAARGDSDPDSPDLSMWGGKDYRPLKQTVVFLFYVAILVGLGAAVGISQAPAIDPAVQQQAAVAPQPEAEAEDEEGAESQEAQAARYELAMREAAAASAAGPEPEIKLPWWFYVLAIACALPLPGAIMVIALEDSLVRALNPATTFFFIRAMGKAYFVLWGLFAAILGMRELVMGLTAEMSAFVRFPLETLIGSYFMLALFAMMGYALYQYHQELGYDVKVDFDTLRKKQAAAANKGADPFTQQVDALVADGKVDDAMRLVLDGMRYDKLNPDLNEKAHKLHLLKGDNAKTLAHGQQYLKALVAARRGAKALGVLKKLQEMDPAFAPEADSLLGLAEAALAQRDHLKAIDLVKGFDKRFPKHADIPAVYFLGARITSEHLRQDDRAMAILKALLQRYPESPVAREATQYLAVLAKMAAPAPLAVAAAK